MNRGSICATPLDRAFPEPNPDFDDSRESIYD